MKLLGRIITSILLLSYCVSLALQADFLCHLLSPLIMIIGFYKVYKAFYIMEYKMHRQLQGLSLSICYFIWTLTTILWGILDIGYQIKPMDFDVFAVGNALTKIFLAIILIINSYQYFRKWNGVQILLDTAVISFFVINLTWIAFLDEDFKNIVLLQSDPAITVGIITDIVIITWIAIYFISIRNGRIKLFNRFLVSGALLYGLVDLVYYYKRFYGTYEPNLYHDAAYMLAFLLVVAAAQLRLKLKDTELYSVINNTGRKGNTYYLFSAPLILIIFKGFSIPDLFSFVIVILLYNIFSNYIQKNIYKESLLLKEQEYNTILEQKVKIRTEELMEKNQELQMLLNQDTVTGLYNRRFLLTYLEEQIKNIKDGETILLLYIDINRFRMIKTMFGHYIGDKILREMARKLKPMENLASRSILASYGDDTYLFAVTGNYSYDKGYEIAQEAIRLGSDIYRVDEYQIRVTVNIGISLYPCDANTKEDLIKNADIAMTQARMQGFNVVQVFDEKLSEAIYRKNAIEIMLKKANFKMDFMVYYQPQFLTESREIIGFEALLRWRTPSGEFIGPGEFIPIAEETGYIIPIGDWVMSMVMKQIIDWNQRFSKRIMIGINVSIKQLNSQHFLDQLKQEIAYWKIQPEWIDIEITETRHLPENRDVMNMLEEIRKLGITISIDDFGTGYSSLSYFKGLPADRIKLAKELIDYIHIDEFDYQLVKSIIMLSKAKGIRVIAEGVETEEQWMALKELQCDEVQGYFFGRPVPAGDIEAAYAEILN